MNKDLNYICQVISNLSGIPVRMYKGKKEILFCSMVSLPVDPMVTYKERIFNIQDNVSYFSTENLNYYGIFRAEDYQIIIGPTRLVSNTLQELHDMAFMADVPAEKVNEFITGMKAIVGLPLERLLQMLCLLSYLINNEKISIDNIEIHNDSQEELSKNLVAQQSELPSSEEPVYRKVTNNFSFENTMLDIVAKGDIFSLSEWLQNPPAAQSGLLADTPLRHLKNMLIATVTLISRSAIRGGMDPNDAIKMAESYIYKTELLNTAEDIINLQYFAVKSFTERVNNLKFGENPSKLVTDVANYIQHNLSKTITAEDIANALFISRPHLSKKFKQEAGISITEFIRNQKIKEAKRLLKYTDKSLLAISGYLGFSSQSHFTHTFKKVTGLNPKEFRE